MMHQSAVISFGDCSLWRETVDEELVFSKLPFPSTKCEDPLMDEFKDGD
jgi:hypothetical protein